MKSLLTESKFTVAQLGVLFALLVAMLGHKFELLSFKLAFLGFVILVLIGALLGLATLVVSLFSKKLHVRTGVLGLALGLGPLIAVFVIIGEGIKVPPIHDISTDVENPPVFTHAYELRGNGENSIDVPAVEVRAQQAAYYTDLAPIALSVQPAEAFDKALAVTEQLGWAVVYKAKDELRFEAVAETALFGFKDDVVVRVQASENGSVVDVRSVSRVGQSDLGANAKRITAFTHAMKN